MAGTMTHDQFMALAELMRMNPDSKSFAVAHGVMVRGQSIADAARSADTNYNAAHQAVNRVRRARDLARTVCGA